IGDNVLYIYFMNTRQTLEFRVSKAVIELIKCVDGNSCEEIKVKLEEKINQAITKDAIKKSLEFLISKNIIVQITDSRSQDLLCEDDVKRYDRQISYLSEFNVGDLSGIIAQKKIKDTKIVIFGCGSIGGNIALELVMAGVSNIVLIDNDIVEDSDSVRHLYYKKKYNGMSKIEALKIELLLINKNINVECIKMRLNPDTDIGKIISDSSFVVNTMDEPYIGYTSLKISRECVKQRKTHYIGGGFDIHLMSTGELIIPEKTPCVECYTQYFKKKLSNWKPENKKGIDEFNEYGGLSSLSLFSSSYACIQILKYIIDSGKIDVDHIVRGEVDFNKYNIQYLDVTKDKNCRTCGGI
uniref:HesA/MoeB/ThiF family protein n=1 Tax=Clostridium sp. TaxID=1506 RepID=UPI002619D7ED